jgi:hypothetical protein
MKPLKAIARRQCVPVYCFDDSEFQTMVCILKLVVLEHSSIESLIDLDANLRN